jgi:hypothetical protein
MFPKEETTPAGMISVAMIRLLDFEKSGGEFDFCVNIASFSPKTRPETGFD